MTSAPIAVTVHPSQFPGVLDAQVRAGLRGGELDPEAVYEDRYQERYGFWRPIIGTVVGREFVARALVWTTAGR